MKEYSKKNNKFINHIFKNFSYNLNEYIKLYKDKYLKNVDVNNNDILRIIAFVLKIDKDKLYVKDITITLFQKFIINKKLNDYYFKNIPLQYILGEQYFFKESYIVNKNVLIPRSDSEILVETAIKYINENNFNTLIDMCTGSGAIGISIANNCNIQTCVLVDISLDAIKLANKNIVKNNVTNKCLCVSSNLFNNIKNKVDIIVSNPPYISKEELLTLDKYVLKEPKLALDGGEEGLDIYKRIIIDSVNYLNENGYLIFEIGYKQKEDLKNINKEFGNNFEYIECIKDLGNNDRVVVFKKRS
jgi:release factor glutamine methyltransferase